MKNIRRLLLACIALCGGCGGSGNPDPPPPPLENDSPGGIWSGTRPNGTAVVMLISETGEFRIVDEFGNQGVGNMVVSNVNQFSVDYMFVPTFGQTLIDGSDSANCSASGTFDERASFDYTVTCRTSMGTDLGGNFPLTYQAEYERDSSLAMVAGDYDNDGDVLTIDAMGMMFEQSVRTGCVLNGRVSIIDGQWNLYGATFTTESCQGEFAPMTGVEWTGIATLIADAGVDTIVGAFTGDVGELPVSLVIVLPRI